jgi:hypothetical protein
VVLVFPDGEERVVDPHKPASILADK